MTTLFDPTRPVKSARLRRFGLGLGRPACEKCMPYTAADREWAAYHLNADATDFDLLPSGADLDRLAGEAEAVDRMSAGLAILSTYAPGGSRVGRVERTPCPLGSGLTTNRLGDISPRIFLLSGTSAWLHHLASLSVCPSNGTGRDPHATLDITWAVELFGSGHLMRWPSVPPTAGRQRPVIPPPSLTDDIVAAYLKCRYKAYLKLRGAVGERSDYESLQVRLAAEYRAAVRSKLLQLHEGSTVIQDPASLLEAIRSGVPLILEATAQDADESCRLDGLERAGGPRPDSGDAYIPILFTPHERITAEDRIRLAFAASVLARLQAGQTAVGRIIHGRQFKPSKVSLPKLVAKVHDAVGEIQVIQTSDSPPTLLLNRHCAECEFLRSCRAAAVEKDDLSLLRGLSPKAIAGLNRRGIFTVTQYSHAFRPGRMRLVAAMQGGKHELSLQALALREKKVYVARRPQLPDAPIRIYLDVEGLPDRDFYYLIGLSWDDGTEARRVSFWADREEDEAAVWGAFLQAIRGVGEDFALFHYGSYEARFLKRMEQRHGGDPGLIARIKARAVNVLSAIHAQVYFPVYSNDLKSVADCLGFRWSATDALGLQSIVWRAAWEATGMDADKQRLLIYNQEDCTALARIVEVLRALARCGAG